MLLSYNGLPVPVAEWMKTRPINVDSERGRDEASGKASECAVSANRTGKRNLHETLAPASVLSNSPNVDISVHAGSSVPARSRASNARSRPDLVTLQIRIEYDVYGRPQLCSRRARRSLSQKKHIEIDSVGEREELIKQEKYGDEYPP